MATRTLRFSLSSYWRIGSGEGAGAVADAVVLRDAAGLPVVPGRTIKGLLRDAMQMATLSGAVAQDRVERWFGSALPGGGTSGGDAQEVRLEEGRFATRQGILWFGSARLSEDWRRWATSDSVDKDLVINALFAYVSSTAIGADGTALEHSLRVAEVAVPMELRAEVRGPDDDRTWVDDIRVSLPLLRSLGSRRNRGFGRVDVSLEDKP